VVAHNRCLLNSIIARIMPGRPSAQINFSSFPANIIITTPESQKKAAPPEEPQQPII